MRPFDGGTAGYAAALVSGVRQCDESAVVLVSDELEAHETRLALDAADVAWAPVRLVGDLSAQQAEALFTPTFIDAEDMGSALRAGDHAAWFLWWRSAAFAPVFRSWPTIDGPKLLRGALSEPTLRTNLAYAIRLRRALEPYVRTSGGLHIDLAGERGRWMAFGDCLALVRSRIPPGDWNLFGSPAPANPSNVQTDEFLVLQRVGSLVPLFVSQDPRLEDDLELMLADVVEAEHVLWDGTTVRVGMRDVVVNSPRPRGVVVTLNGWRTNRRYGSTVTIDLEEAQARLATGLTSMPPEIWREISDAVWRTDFSGRRHAYTTVPKSPMPDRPTRLVVEQFAPAAGEDFVADVRSPHPSRLQMLPAGTSARGAALWEAVVPPYGRGTVVRYGVEWSAGEQRGLLQDAGPRLEMPTLHERFARPPSSDYSFLVGGARPCGWLREALIYYAFVDRFGLSDEAAPFAPADVPRQGFLGGTLVGVAAQLPYLRDLGINTLMLGPLYPSEVHPCYDVCDYESIHPSLGRPEDLAALVEAAHAQGIRVAIDVELAFISARHPFAQDAMRSEHSPYRQWFHWDSSSDRPLGWYGYRGLCALNHDHEAVREYLLALLDRDVAIGIDGFRLDAAHHVAASFWTEVGRRSYEWEREVALLAESYGYWDDQARLRSRLHGCFDYVVLTAIEELFKEGRTLRLLELLNAAGAGWEQRVSFIENHDIDRFGYQTGTGRAGYALALTLLMTLPGIPMLLYGSEAGAEQHLPVDHDISVRYAMPRADARDEAEVARARSILALRALPALQRGALRVESLDAPDHCLAFRRIADEQELVVVVNASASPAEITLRGFETSSVDLKELWSLSPGSALRSEDGRAVSVSLGSYDAVVAHVL